MSKRAIEHQSLSPRCTLARAAAVTRQAARLGFDWPTIGEVIAKVREEIEELDDAIASRNRDAVFAELGDALFALVNVARFLDLSPEDALAGTIARFEKRFAFVRDSLAHTGRRPEEVSLTVLDNLWEEAKRLERAGGD